MHQSINKFVYLLQRLLELFTLYYLEFILLSMHLENLLCLDNTYPLGEVGFSKQAERCCFCRVSHSSSTCPKHLIQEKLMRHPGQMPKAPKLTRFKAKEQDLYSELLTLSPKVESLFSQVTANYNVCLGVRRGFVVSLLLLKQTSRCFYLLHYTSSFSPTAG